MKILKKIFSIKKLNTNKHVEITVIGFRFKLKIKKKIENYFQFLYKKLLKTWSSYHYDAILREIDFYIDNQNCWEYMPHDIWLIFMLVLLKNKNYGIAKKILRRYIKVYGVEHISDYIPIGSFAYENGYNNELLKREYFVFKKLEKNTHNINFNIQFKNKSIAIVGNSGFNIGKNTGSDIDNHDIVIRFNNYPSGYEKDYGAKTNIWVRGIGAKENEIKPRDISNYDYIIWYFDIWHVPLRYNIIEILYSDLKKYPTKILYTTYNSAKFLLDEYDVIFPTSGAIIATSLLLNSNCYKNIDIYGFSFLDEHNYDESHYYDSLCRINLDHNMKEERIALRNLYMKGDKQ